MISRDGGLHHPQKCLLGWEKVPGAPGKSPRRPGVRHKESLIDRRLRPVQPSWSSDTGFVEQLNRLDALGYGLGMGRGTFGFWLGGGVAVLIVAVVAAWWLVSASSVDTRSSNGSGARGEQASAIQAERGPAPASRVFQDHDPSSGASVSDDAPSAATSPDLDGDEMAAAAWAAVDMDEVRKAMPDNFYWKLSAPSKDPQVLEERDAERARWNVEWGKILSGTASEEEIRAFYDQRARLSGDYIEFTSYLLDHYREKLPERDIGLLELARRMHNSRLEEIPRKYEEALERKRQQDAAREAWLAGEEDFAAPRADSE